MPKYRVTYFYLATGMEGIADTRDYGTVEASNPEEARRKVADKEASLSRSSDWSQKRLSDWMMSCLEAHELRS